MLKIIRYALYSLAIMAGVLGLFVGGIPLVEYVLEMLHDAEYRYYYDTHYLNEPEIIFLLSMILLVGVRIAMGLDKGIRPANPPDSGLSAKKPVAPAPAEETSQPSVAADTTALPVETADEKLTRLLKQKKE
jgi:hypothetical protein